MSFGCFHLIFCQSDAFNSLFFFFPDQITNFDDFRKVYSRSTLYTIQGGEHGGSVVECRTPERGVRGSRPTAAVLCP